MGWLLDTLTGKGREASGTNGAALVISCDINGSPTGSGALTAPYTIQQLATSSVVALPNHDFTNGGVIKASINNSGIIMVGGSNVTSANNGSGIGYPLSPGEAFPAAVANLDTVFIVLAAGNSSTTDFIAVTGN